MQENKGVKKYVLTRQAHFGYTKQSYVGGTVIEVNFDANRYTANGATFEDLRDINIALRAGFLDAFSKETKKKVDDEVKKHEEFHNKITESKKEKPQKMEVIKSDEDLIEPIPIESKKNEELKEEKKEMEIIKENSDDTARGMTVLRSQPQELEESSQGTVVAVIGNGNEGVNTSNSGPKEVKANKKRTKESEEKALKNAEKRKTEALNKRKNNKNKEEK